jgi:hypothetical protein
MHARVCDKLTYVRYYSSEVVMVNLFLSPPFLCFLKLPLVVAEFVTRPQVLANVEST